MAPDIGRAARGIVPDVDLDVMIYGCTSGTVAIGEMEVFQSMKNARGDYPCTTPITAAMAAFKTLGAKKISILTPYIRSVNLEVAEYFKGRGLDIANMGLHDLRSKLTIIPQVVHSRLVRTSAYETEHRGFESGYGNNS